MSKENSYSGTLHNALTSETTIVGKVVSQKDIRIDGKLDGQLECHGKVIVGESGQITGDINAINAEVIGHITGNVIVTEMLTLKSSAILEGDVQVHRLAIEPGAILNGKCTMVQSHE